MIAILVLFQLANVEEFFQDIKYPLGWDQYKVAAQMNGNLDPPGVKASPGSYFSALVSMMTTWGYQTWKERSGCAIRLEAVTKSDTV
ncbi:hypothetical protein ANCDUO_18811 [Ancylostoma duodenale]|uniref:Uncharacterized protein n=1 Tax=Ancylostoma duodenale TaxID=51022 RepID=A0A0C2C478_9BILA|nr:hypothetical protein ANCDUO_18811 [Ancylostoma duodenale]